MTQHVQRLSELALSLSRQELEAQERETTFSARMNMLLERENAASRMEADLTRRAEASLQREVALEAELARRAEASRQREMAVEAELALRAEASTQREVAMVAELARRAEASMQREVAVLKREENLAEEAAYYRELPLFKQAIQFRAWLRQRKG